MNSEYKNNQIKLMINQVKQYAQEIQKGLEWLEREIEEDKHSNNSQEATDNNYNKIFDQLSIIQTNIKNLRINFNKLKLAITKNVLPTPHITLGEYLKNTREKKGKSQLEIAQKLKVSKSAVCRWEKSEMLPTINALKKIAEAYGADYEKLLKYYLQEKAIKKK